MFKNAVKNQKNNRNRAEQGRPLFLEVIEPADNEMPICEGCQGVGEVNDTACLSCNGRGWAESYTQIGHTEITKRGVL
ncbi:MAG: hypothetical protein A2252_05895 [Elusimicrobia bacterium RIFOXYA2_FULL_39_19]|nr:MAG: hypothetical protein A2252_05895 [Elusimicrobia bacterium RIFOXYA2_FULL_39_19]